MHIHKKSVTTKPLSIESSIPNAKPDQDKKCPDSIREKIWFAVWTTWHIIILTVLIIGCAWINETIIFIACGLIVSGCIIICFTAVQGDIITTGIYLVAVGLTFGIISGFVFLERYMNLLHIMRLYRVTLNASWNQK